MSAVCRPGSENLHARDFKHTPTQELGLGGAKEFLTSAESDLCTFTAIVQRQCSCSVRFWEMLSRKAGQAYPPLANGGGPRGDTGAWLKMVQLPSARSVRLCGFMEQDSLHLPPCPRRWVLPWTFMKNKRLLCGGSRYRPMVSAALRFMEEGRLSQKSPC